MKSQSFPYSHWTKALGIVIILLGVVSFFVKYSRSGLFDSNELAVGLCWGLVFIFFSRERTDDEMIHALKYKALAKAMVIAFFVTHLYNYLLLNWRLKRPGDTILSISAYQFFALAMIIATALFYYLKHRLSLTEHK